MLFGFRQSHEHAPAGDLMDTGGAEGTNSEGPFDGDFFERSLRQLHCGGVSGSPAGQATLKRGPSPAEASPAASSAKIAGAV